MTTYHISEKGRPNICRAQDGNCPITNFDGAHFDNKEEARKYVETALSAAHGSTSTLRKASVVDSEKKVTPVAKKEITIPDAYKAQPKKLSKYEQTVKEINDLRELKDVVGEDDIEKINGKIRGKSIHLNKYKMEHEVSVRNSENLENAVFDNNSSASDKKKAIAEYLNNPVNAEKVQRDFQNAGYDLNDSEYLKNLAHNGEGSNLVIRQALKNSYGNKDSEFLIAVAEAAQETETTTFNDRFSGSDKVSQKAAFFNKNGDFVDPEFDKDEEEVPEFLKDDPDFVIDDEEESEED